MENTRCCIVDDDLSPSRADNVGARRIRSLIADLKQSGIQVVESCSHSDGLANVTSDSSISLLMVNWNLGKNNTASNKHATGEIRTVGGGRGGDSSHLTDPVIDEISRALLWPPIPSPHAVRRIRDHLMTTTPLLPLEHKPGFSFLGNLIVATGLPSI